MTVEDSPLGRLAAFADRLGVDVADLLTDALTLLEREYGLGDREATSRPAVVTAGEYAALEDGSRWGPQKAEFIRVYLATHSTARATARVGIATNTFYRWVYGDTLFEGLLRKCGWRPRGEPVAVADR